MSPAHGRKRRRAKGRWIDARRVHRKFLRLDRNTKRELEAIGLGHRHVSQNPQDTFNDLFNPGLSFKPNASSRRTRLRT